MRVLVIIPAAGMGIRFGGQLPKQFQPLGGKPILQHAVERFLLDAGVVRIVIPVSEMLLAVVKQSGGDRVRFVAGGATRQESVMRGFEAASDEVDLVAVHDAVRPFFRIETFHALLQAADEHGAAAPVVSVADTIHMLRDGFIESTPDRSTLGAAQTPQCFRPAILGDILTRAAAEGIDQTDEAALAVRYGYRVAAVAGDPNNFKITRPEDLALAEARLSELA